MGGGNFVTQSYPTYFHQFWTQKTLSKSEAVADFKEVTAAERAELEKHDAGFVEPDALFVEMWKNTYPGMDWIKYNADTGYFEINPLFAGIKVGRTDITYQEAIAIYNRATAGTNLMYTYNSQKARINLPPYNYGNPFNVGQIISHNYTHEVLILALNYGSYVSGVQPITTCPKLETIFGAITMTNNKDWSAKGCPNLKYIKFYFTGKNNIDISDSPLIALESFQTTLAGKGASSSATITVHPDVYAKLTDETNTEWHQILLEATEKNIIFATT